MMKESKGGTFAPADMKVLKSALYCYRLALLRNEDSERSSSDELTKVANLLHRLDRIS